MTERFDHLGQMTVGIDELERSDWTILIPDSILARLRADGVPLPRSRSCSTR